MKRNREQGGECTIHPALKSLGTEGDPSPNAKLLRSPKGSSPARPDGDSILASPLRPSSLLLMAGPHKSGSHAGFREIALNFIQYQASPIKQRTSVKILRLQDLLESRHAFGSGKEWLKAEADGREPGDELPMLDGEDSHELEEVTASASSESITEPESEDVLVRVMRENPELRYAGKAPPYGSGEEVTMRASSESVTEPESEDVLVRVMRENPGLRYAGKAPPYVSGSCLPGSSKSGSFKASRVENGSVSQVKQVGIIITDGTPPASQSLDHTDPTTSSVENLETVSPVGTSSGLTKPETQSGSSAISKTRDRSKSQSHSLNESALTFSQPTIGPLVAFLDMLERGSSAPWESQPVIDIDD